MLIRNYALLATGILVLGMAIGGCGEGASPPPPRAATIELSPTALTLVPAQQYGLVALARDAAGRTIDVTISWASSTPSVATVSPQGTVTAVAPGQATITASSGDAGGHATIDVKPGGYITAAGGTAMSEDGNARLSVPAGAVSQGIAVTVSAVPSPRADFRLVTGTSYTFAPAGLTFFTPATLTIRYSRGAIPGGVQSELRTYELADTGWRALGGAVIDTLAGTVGTPVARMNTFALLGQGPPATIERASSLLIEARVGATLVQPRGAIVRNERNQLLRNVVVTFTVTQGGGRIGAAAGSTATALSNDFGEARPPGWTLGTTPGVNTVSAAVPGLAPVTLTARGVAFQWILVGQAHVCGTVFGDEGYCWGANGSGQLGIGQITSGSAVPQRLTGLGPVGGLSAGGGHTCGISVQMTGYCWGENGFGQVGDGTNDRRSSPIPLSRPFVFFAAGGLHTCGVTADVLGVYCWGFNSNGQIGDGTDAHKSVPTRVNTVETFVWLVSGLAHSCGLTLFGVAHCWGDWGAEGSAAPPGRREPAPVSAQLFFTLAAGNAHTCGLDIGDRAFCWGNNADGQLGDGTTINQLAPVPVTGGLTFFRLTAGASHTCGRGTDGFVYCWGANQFGQLGDGSTSRRLTPVRVGGSVSFSDIAAGGNSTCGVANSSTAYCWGQNSFGQLGDGTTFDRRLPTAVIFPPP